MKIEKIKISYSTTIPIMSYGVNDKIGVEMELTPDVSKGANEQFNLEQLIQEHKANVDGIVRKLYPEKFAYDAPSLSNITHDEPPQFKQPSTHEEIRIGDIEGDIRSCTDLKILETYRFIAPSKPEFKKAYDEMYAKLSNKTK